MPQIKPLQVDLSDLRQVLVAATPLPREYTFTVSMAAIRRALAQARPGDEYLRFTDTALEGEQRGATEFTIEVL